MRCPKCDAVCEIGVKAGSFDNGEEGPAPVPVKSAQVSVPAAEPILAGPDSTIAGTVEDDNNPYSVPRDPRQKEICPNCKKTVPPGTIACNQCGFNRQTGTTAERVHEKLAKQWEAGWGMRVRLGIFLAIQGMMFPATLIVAQSDGDLAGLLATWIIGTLLMSFLLGTFPRLT